MRLGRGVLTLACLLFGSLSGSSQDVSGPVLGYMWSLESHALRPVQGIVGSATVGDPVELGLPVSRAVSLDGRRFLVSSSASSTVLLLDLESAPPSFAALTDLPGEFSFGVASRQGTAAALYYAAERKIRVLSGLVRSPQVSSVLDVPSPGAVSRMAIRDDGLLLVYGVSGSGSDSLFVWSRRSGIRLMTVAESVSDVAFFGNGDVVVSDPVANEVFSIRGPDGAAQRVFLAGVSSGISDPVAVRVTDQDRIYVASAGTSSVMALDSAGRVLEVLPCGCGLTGLDPLGPSLYRLTESLHGTVYLLETPAGRDRVVFAPVLARAPAPIEPYGSENDAGSETP